MSTSAEKDLIRYLKKHAKEKVPFEDMETGEETHMSRSEALSLVVWKLAHGHAVYADSEGSDGKVRRKLYKYYPPDKGVINLLFDHLIGKPKAPPAKEKEDRNARGVPTTKKTSEALDKFRQTEGGRNANSGSRRPAKTSVKESLSKQLGKLGVPRHRDKGAQRSNQEHRVETATS
jgi:hypothetical protein